MKTPHILLCALVFASCNPKVNTTLSSTATPLDHQEEVLVLTLNDPIPETATHLGVVKVGDTGFSTNCSFAVVMEKATIEARKAGGNLLKITSHKTPNPMSSCHRITADILKVGDLNLFKEQIGKLEASPIDSTWDYALLHVYRPKSHTGSLIGYDVYLGDSILCRATNNSKHTIKVRKKGMNSIWAKTESKTEVPIDVEYGKTYYLRCEIITGIMVGRPQMTWVGHQTGRAEYELIKSKKR